MNGNQQQLVKGFIKAGSHVRRKHKRKRKHKHKRKDVHTSEISTSTRKYAGAVFRLGTVNLFHVSPLTQSLIIFLMLVLICLRHPGSHVRRNDASISASGSHVLFLVLALMLASYVVRVNQFEETNGILPYRKDNNGNPVIIHTSNNNVVYECKDWTTQACGHVIPNLLLVLC